jgi:hypothetical protein
VNVLHLLFRFAPRSRAGGGTDGREVVATGIEGVEYVGSPVAPGRATDRPSEPPCVT